LRPIWIAWREPQGTRIAPYLFDPTAPVCYFPVNAKVSSPWPRDWLRMMCGACTNLSIIS
jgi:hypothetical protein